jgi:hypothetical protein
MKGIALDAKSTVLPVETNDLHPAKSEKMVVQAAQPRRNSASPDEFFWQHEKMPGLRRAFLLVFANAEGKSAAPQAPPSMANRYSAAISSASPS